MRFDQLCGTQGQARLQTAEARHVILNFPEQSQASPHLPSLKVLASPCRRCMGFGSIPYSAVSLRDESLRATISKAVQALWPWLSQLFCRNFGHELFWRGIERSFGGGAANTPIWGTSFTLAEPAGYPCINIGPWGRDYHHWLERLHAPYAFETLPKVLLAVIDAVFKRG